MDIPSPEQLAARLDDAQRGIVLAGPASFAEADVLPEGLFDEDIEWYRESGEETFSWQPTALGEKVRTLLEDQGGMTVRRDVSDRARKAR